MPGFRSVDPLVGHQRIDVFGLPDTTQRLDYGLINLFTSIFWGGIEATYVQANGSIRMGGLVAITPILSGGRLVYQAAEIPNTANLGKAVQVALTSMTNGQYGWVGISGCLPVNCTASVAADTGVGIAGAGQAGAISAGKQILGMRSVVPATQTVVKNGCFANNNSLQLFVPNTDGWFIGAYLSGTGIAATTTVVDVDPSNNIVTLSLATTAAVNGAVTATYNNGTVFFNVCHFNTPIAQGQIT